MPSSESTRRWTLSEQPATRFRITQILQTTLGDFTGKVSSMRTVIGIIILSLIALILVVSGVIKVEWIPFFFAGAAIRSIIIRYRNAKDS